jgi:hypothetical protein
MNYYYYYYFIIIIIIIIIVSAIDLRLIEYLYLLHILVFYM